MQAWNALGTEYQKATLYPIMYPFLHSALHKYRCHPILGTAALTLVLGVATYWTIPFVDRSKDYLLHHNDPNYRKCRDEKIADACVGFCMDGFESILFYDRNKYDLDSLKPGMFFEDSVLKRGIGLKYISVCRPCQRLYAVGGDEVSCYEFYRVIDSASKQTRIGTLEAGI